LKKLLSLLE